VGLQDFDDRLSAATVKLLIWFVMPLTGLGGLIGGVQIMRESWGVITGSGTPGTFVANKLECTTIDSLRHGSTTTCGFTGPFTSTDGRIHFNVAEMNGSPHGMKPGDSAAAIYTGVTGPPPQVFGKGNLADFTFGVALTVGGLALIGLWLFLVVRRWRRARI
jgi:hypothetical protein